jgi:DNA-binding response OmpR family regulator
MSMKEIKTLIIEEQLPVVEKIQKELEKHGHVVTKTISPKTGVLRAKAFDFDFFVINCGENGKDGIDFIKSLSSEKDIDDVPVLFVFDEAVKLDVRLLKFNKRFEIIRLPFDPVEFKLRLDQLKGKEKSEPQSLNINSEPEAESDEPQTNKVLLVEDNPLNQKVLGMFISKLGFEHDVASNGQMSVDLATENEYRYILMDIYMPGMDGTEATVKIRENEEKAGRNRSKIIAITANESDESVKRCYDSGMDDYLVKPFTLEILREKLL